MGGTGLYHIRRKPNSSGSSLGSSSLRLSSAARSPPADSGGSGEKSAAIHGQPHFIPVMPEPAADSLACSSRSARASSTLPNRS